MSKKIEFRFTNANPLFSVQKCLLQVRHKSPDQSQFVMLIQSNGFDKFLGADSSLHFLKYTQTSQIRMR